MPKIYKRLVKQVAAKGAKSAHAVATAQLEKSGLMRDGKLTAKGKKRQAMGPAGRAKDRAAKASSGHKPSDYTYNSKTNRATLKKGKKGRRK